MSKSATDVIQDALFSAFIDAVESMKANAGGVPNTMLREINALHANSTAADLPDHLKAALRTSVSNTLNRLRKEGYSVAPTTPVRSSSTGKRAR